MNQLMRKEYEKLSLVSFQLNKKLRKLADAGFIEEDGCYFLKKFSNTIKHIPVSHFMDTTGRVIKMWIEDSANSFYVNDYVEENILEQGVLFTQAIFNIWNSNYNKSLPLRARFSIDYGDELEGFIGLGKPYLLKVKFYVKRIDEEDLAIYDGLIDYSQLNKSDLLDDENEPGNCIPQPLLIVDSHDVGFTNL